MSRLVQAPEQIEATRPEQSNWVSANAGSGKTHVLTQRVARLLLSGAEPQKILCLTYTKAAAAEMQTRLFQTLGAWAMEPEAGLATRLGDLEGAGPVHHPARLAEARRLFARALETPGGLKIQTIHAFCDTLLRRFPLEAGLSPRFEVSDDRQSTRLHAHLRVAMAEDAEARTDDAFDRAVARLNEGGVDDLAAGVLTRRAPFRTQDPEPALAAYFGPAANLSALDVAQRAVTMLNAADLALLAQTIEQSESKKAKPLAGAIRALSPGFAEPEVATHAFADALLRKKDWEPRGDLVSKAMVAIQPDVAARVAKLAEWAKTTRNEILAAQAAQRARDLHCFGHSLISRLDGAKATQGLVDFDDLIERTRDLLTRADMRAWVLYKLDQGIDHILVDEAQDTSPRQWDVIRAIADEFLAGEGARPEGRSLFVVGDEKQSIYSFQGAEPQAFGHMREVFAEGLDRLGTPLGQPKLETSYRSAPAILNFVDVVFDGAAAEGLTMATEPVRHKAHRSSDAGRVDLWSPVPKSENPKDDDWWKPVDAPPPSDPKTVLADDVARHIRELVEHGELPRRADGTTRRVRAGDILVLVTRRDRLARGIIRQLKAEGVKVAGSDRMSLTAELAVQDMLALVRVVLMPSDDLSLAALLRSPICGVTEEELFALARGRKGTLWQAVRAAPDHAEIAAFLDDMSRQADFMRPYEFLERALMQHDARRRLLARLGPEIEDPIDELLVQALAFESREAPSLAGFLAWIEEGEINVKREMEHGLDAVRVMTVHGAKGLEAPIVILPDTFAGPSSSGSRPLLLPAEAKGNAPPLVLWAGEKAQDDSGTREARNAAEAREAAERKRLLYVALTRAEDWLILCGAEPRRKAAECWYDLLENAFERLPEDRVRLVQTPEGTREFRRFEIGRSGYAAKVDMGGGQDPRTTTSPSLPPIPGPALYEPRMERGSPTGLEAKTGLGRSEFDRATALRRGSAVHAVLERVADLPEAKRRVLAVRLLGGQFPDLDQALREAVLAEADAVLAMAEAKWIFGPGSAAEISLRIDSNDSSPPMIGRVDRLIVRPDQIWVIDVKTDGQPPGDAGDVSKAYRAQLGAYASAASRIWTGKQVHTALLWTAVPSLMEVDADACVATFRNTSFARTGRA